MAGLIKGLILTVLLAASTVAYREFYDDYTSQEPFETTPEPFETSPEPDMTWMITCYDTAKGTHVLAKYCAISYSLDGTCDYAGGPVKYTAHNGTEADDAIRVGLDVHISGLRYSSSEACKRHLIETLPVYSDPSTTPGPPPKLPETTHSSYTTTTRPSTTSGQPKCLIDSYSYAMTFIWDASYNTYKNNMRESLAAQALFANTTIMMLGDYASYQISAIGGQTKDGNCRFRSDTGRKEKTGYKRVNRAVEIYEEYFEESPEEYEYPIHACAVNAPLKRFLRETKDRRQIIFNFADDTDETVYRKDTTLNFEAEYAGQQARDLNELRAAGVTVITITSSNITSGTGDKTFNIEGLDLDNITPYFVEQVLLDGCSIDEKKMGKKAVVDLIKKNLQ